VATLKNLVGQGAEIAEALDITLRHQHRQAAYLILDSIPDRDATLIQAAHKGCVEAVKALLAKGADIHAKDTLQMTALHWAMQVTPPLDNQTAIVDILLAHGADVKAKDHFGKTALGRASMQAEGANAASIALLIRQGANVNERDDLRITPLESAVLAANPEMVQLLLQHGADANAVDNTGYSNPLEDACWQESLMKPFELSKREKLQRIIRLLVDHGARLRVRPVQLSTLANCPGVGKK
jgi:cytohesin